MSTIFLPPLGPDSFWIFGIGRHRETAPHGSRGRDGSGLSAPYTIPKMTMCFRIRLTFRSSLTSSVTSRHRHQVFFYHIDRLNHSETLGLQRSHGSPHLTVEYPRGRTRVFTNATLVVLSLLQARPVARPYAIQYTIAMPDVASHLYTITLTASGLM